MAESKKTLPYFVRSHAHTGHHMGEYAGKVLELVDHIPFQAPTAQAAAAMAQDSTLLEYTPEESETIQEPVQE